MASLVKYDPSVEQAEPDEAQTTQEIIDTLRMISETTFKDSGHALRSVHAKGQGLLRGQLEIMPDLPEHLAQGLFSKAGIHKVAMRFSTIPGDILDDSISVPRGLAIKVSDVEGERLSASGEEATQDFVMVNSPAFAAPTAKAFLNNLKPLAKTTDKAEHLKKVLASALYGVEAMLEAVGGESSLLKSLGGHPRTHILGETFYSQAAIRYGDYIAKFGLFPASEDIVALTGASLDAKGGPDVIRDSVRNFTLNNSPVWEFKVQLCADLAHMPVEDASKPWDEALSPYETVAYLTCEPQDAWTEQNIREIDDCMAFSPWHCLKAHQPLGSVMRVRKQAYAMSSSFRREHNGCPFHHMG